MPYATDADLVGRVAAAASVSPVARAFALGDAKGMIELGSYGCLALPAHVFLAAHYLQLRGFIEGGENGIVKKAKIGEIEAEYAVTPGDSSDGLLASTIYGRQFLQIRDTLVSFPEVG